MFEKENALHIRQAVTNVHCEQQIGRYCSIIVQCDHTALGVKGGFPMSNFARLYRFSDYRMWNICRKNTSSVNFQAIFAHARAILTPPRKMLLYVNLPFTKQSSCHKQ